MKLFNIERSSTVEVNTDPQGRCYNGCHFSSELVGTPWEVLEHEVTEDKIERRLEFWRDLSAYAVSQRGNSAHTNYRKVEILKCT